MNKKMSLGNFSKEELLAKLPKNINSVHVVLMVVSLILLALTIYFTVSYFGAVNDKKDVNKQITQRQQQINSLGELQNIAALQSQLEQALQDVIDKSPFPAQISDTEIAYSIIVAARESAITCYQYNPSSPDIAIINKGSYTEQRYSISSQGATDTSGEKIVRIVKFLEALEESYDTSSTSGLSLSDGDGDGYWTFRFTYSIFTLPAQ